MQQTFFCQLLTQNSNLRKPTNFLFNARMPCSLCDVTSQNILWKYYGEGDTTLFSFRDFYLFELIFLFIYN